MAHMTKKQIEEFSKEGLRGEDTKKLQSVELIPDINTQPQENFMIQMSSKGYSEWLCEENDIYDELFKDEVK
ncbi:hypothetical protein KKB18_06440 [bacterium]|nr:hypothetical protein [bacterium]